MDTIELINRYLLRHRINYDISENDGYIYYSMKYENGSIEIVYSRFGGDNFSFNVNVKKCEYMELRTFSAHIFDSDLSFVVLDGLFNIGFGLMK